MIEKVQLQEKKLSDYRKFIPDEQMLEIRKLAKSLRGKRMVHVNATSNPGGGGVAVILHALIPLSRDLGIDAEWYVIKPPDDFFRITNKIHNGLQGSDRKLTRKEKDYYVKYSKKIARELEKISADIYILHDPQPLLTASFSKKIRPAISRIHIDLSSPNKDTWKLLFPHFKPYEKVIVSTHEFINEHLPKEKVEVFPPAIDPLASKNIPMKKEHARLILENLGINISKPIIAQVSRLDPFKDPIGVIQAFYIAQKSIPDLQLVLMAQNLASDNPGSKKIYQEVSRYTKGDPSIFLYYNPKEIDYENNTLVNAIQVASDVILQKSTKEGFGLTVTEAMWKEKAVIGGRVGGIKVQIRDGYNGYLVSTVNHCASKIVELINNKKLRNTFGKRAKKSVTQNFLMTRLLLDYLKISNEVIAKK